MGTMLYDSAGRPITSANPLAVSGSFTLTGRTVIENAAKTLTVDATVGGKPLPTIPADATGAYIIPEGGDMRAFWDGTAPTATVGNLVIYGDQIKILTRAELLAFRAIRTGTTDGSLTITYYK